MNKTKTAMITVCGRPNVGKSSLTNALVGEKIAIVSNKPQTTRNRIYGVVNRGDTQYVLLDTPGFHKARNRLGDYMVKVTRESIADVDAVLLLVEPVAHVGIPEAELIEKIKASHLPAILCINKIDTVEKKDDLLAVIAAYEVKNGARLADLIRRPRLSYAALAPFDPDRPALDPAVAREAEITIKYAGYIDRQLRQVEEMRRLEDRVLPQDIDYLSIHGLRMEARQKLQDIRPHNLGQASRVSGVSPADVAVLMIYLKQAENATH